jgi:hypothetical protein
MAFYRSRRRVDCRPELLAAEREDARSDFRHLTILVVVAVIVLGVLWLYAETSNRSLITDVRPSLMPRVEQMTTGSGELERTADEPATPAVPENRTLETVVPKGPQPTDQ